MPLGWEHGSDSFENKIGINIFDKKYFIFSAEVGSRSSGENNIVYYPYETYTEYNFSGFPSGNINNAKFFNFSLLWNVNSYVDINLSLNSTSYNSKIKDSIFVFGMNLSLPLKVLQFI